MTGENNASSFFACAVAGKIQMGLWESGIQCIQERCHCSAAIMLCSHLLHKDKLKQKRVCCQFKKTGHEYIISLLLHLQSVRFQ